MKVLHVFGGGESGGSRAHVLALCAAPMATGNADRAELVCLLEGPVAAEARKLGVRLTVVPMYALSDFSAIPRLRRLIRHRSPSIVHTHGVRANFIGRLAAHGVAPAVVSTIHSSPRDDYAAGFRRCLYPSIERSTWGRVDRFIAVSNSLRNELVRNGVDDDRISVVYNALHPLSADLPCCSRAEVRAQLGVLPSEHLLVSVGRLEPVKGVDRLLTILARLSGRLQFRALIVGDGSERARLERQAGELGLHRCVSFLGFRNDIPDLLRAADLLVMASRMEGCPMVLLEAMAAEVPVVVSAVGGATELVQIARNGYAVPAADAEQFASRIERLLNDTQHRRWLAGQGSHALQRHFSPDAFRNGTRGAYARALTEVGMGCAGPSAEAP